MPLFFDKDRSVVQCQFLCGIVRQILSTSETELMTYSNGRSRHPVTSQPYLVHTVSVLCIVPSYRFFVNYFMIKPSDQ